MLFASHLEMMTNGTWKFSYEVLMTKLIDKLGKSWQIIAMKSDYSKLILFLRLVFDKFFLLLLLLLLSLLLLLLLLLLLIKLMILMIS